MPAMHVSASCNCILKVVKYTDMLCSIIVWHYAVLQCSFICCTS